MPNVTLKLSIGNFSVEITGPEAYAAQKLEELIGRYLTASVKTVSSDVSSAAPSPGGKRMSAAEFLKKVNHNNQTDRAIVLGYYIERMEIPSSFTTGELGELGKRTKHPFTNISDSVARLVGRGLMMSAGEKEGQRAYALTASGEEYVESMIAK